ncbi:hypothetical protein ACFFUB_03485 [Algimonas porphyrae]|uniref:Lipoprotein n=1 Tax=Algimonas porphyrae TaxID=1128113 RepID=A0ABQ5UY10_9PROT|nr:hypothetical protein [Algimonas porphyrae]GLQ20171.1 hypothetical protein GCM10007854_11260 [Algimonas porphyrae]
MRGFLIIAAMAGLTACQPPADDTPGMFEPFAATRVADAACMFFADGDASQDQYMFATREDDVDHIAYVQFKGELLKLIPRDVPDFAGEPLDVTYDVLDYLNWKVRLQAEPTGTDAGSAGYDGSLTLMLDSSELSTSADIYGECRV